MRLTELTAFVISLITSRRHILEDHNYLGGRYHKATGAAQQERRG